MKLEKYVQWTGINTQEVIDYFNDFEEQVFNCRTMDKDFIDICKISPFAIELTITIGADVNIICKLNNYIYYSDNQEKFNYHNFCVIPETTFNILQFGEGGFPCNGLFTVNKIKEKEKMSVYKYIPKETQIIEAIQWTDKDNNFELIKYFVEQYGYEVLFTSFKGSPRLILQHKESGKIHSVPCDLECYITKQGKDRNGCFILDVYYKKEFELIYREL